jgi:tRNA uridine 5-carboxymethylaminomethyl modification enzyme
VLIDDLVNKGTQEPYRMFTSRAEYRILLRQDNADLRLTEKGYNLGLATEERYATMVSKRDNINLLLKDLAKSRVVPEVVNSGLELLNTATITEKTPAINLIRRPNFGLKNIREIDPEMNTLLASYAEDEIEQSEIQIKYEAYIDREQKLAEKIESLEDYKIKPDFDYDRVKALSSEAREKLKRMKPETIGQISRISGVSPADVSILTVYLGK